MSARSDTVAIATTEQTIAVCAALGDAMRWRILELLGEEARSASSLGEALPISRQAIAKHLDILAAAGLVESGRVGREVRYRSIGARLLSVGRTLEAAGSGWDRRLAALRDLSEARVTQAAREP